VRGLGLSMEVLCRRLVAGRLYDLEEDLPLFVTSDQLGIVIKDV
jgi:hypothetical protein